MSSINAGGVQALSTDNWDANLDSATCEVFRMMLNSELSPEPGNRPAMAEVTAVVGLAGHICGVFTLKCSAHAAVLMTAAMLGIPEAEVNQQEWDAVGEVCNMLAGNFKSKLHGIGDRCMLSVPTVVCGADYRLHALVNGVRVERGFRFQGEPIWVAVDIEK
jgi:chemotaxis protein CheX